MKSRLEAEAQRRCAEGISVYLEKQHRKHITKGLTTGIFSGIVCSVGLFAFEIFKFPEDQFQNKLIYAVPFVLSTVTATAYSLMTVDNKDAEGVDDFNAVCDELSKAEEEKEENASDEDEDDETKV